MIVIHKPELSIEGDFAIISSKFEINDKTDVLWYKVNLKFKDLLDIENMDAFLVGLLFLGLKTGNDIKLNGSISAKLFYTINHYVIKVLCFANSEYEPIKIFPKHLNNLNFNTGNVAGTGLSCGVDSLATYCDHLNETEPFKIEYFTFFNVGSHGDNGGTKARKIFWKRLESIEGFASDVKKEVISVDSNLSEILQMKFQQTYNLRNISCALLFQKLFKNYYYSSGTRFDHFSTNKNEVADLDMLIIPNLSTESINFHVSVLQYNRIERTELIARYPETYNFLDVCTHPKTFGEKINCSNCYKCNRTMLTLECLGDLDKYQKVFDIKKFRRNKNKYLGFLLYKKKLTLDKELINFLKQQGFKYSLSVYFFAFKFILYRKKRIVMNKLNL